jgi:hypothetical protein
MLITVIGRGHGGTRAMSHTLSASGVYMGEPLNVSGDLLPPDAMYEACRVFARYVRHVGGIEWDFSRVLDGPVDPAFTRLVEQYLATVLGSQADHRGWKLPETTLVLPWIIRMFPEARFIYWTRDPRDAILGAHLTDDLADFGVPYEHTESVRLRRAISWRYQYEIMRATPAPDHCIEVRFEDFVLHQEATLARIENFLGFPLARIPVRPESVGRWRTDEGEHDFDLFPREALYAEENGFS